MTLFAARICAAQLLIPPWQQPDEPSHVFFVSALVDHPADPLAPLIDREVERAIVESMARNFWWEHYGEQAPNPAPSRFTDGPEQIAGQGGPPGGPRLYYYAVAALLRLTGLQTPEQHLYAMRLLSSVLALLALFAAWAGTRVLLGEAMAFCVTATMALHPQYLLVGTTASPDAFMDLCGAVVWLCTAMMLRDRYVAPMLALMSVTAVAAALTRRPATPLVVLPPIVALGYLADRRSWRSVALIVGGVALALIGGAYLLGATGGAANVAWQWMNREGLHIERLVSIPMENPAYLRSFTLVLFQSFWMTAGWMRYLPPLWWLWCVGALSVFAGAGVARMVWSGSSERLAVVIAVIFVAVQLLSIYAFYIPLQHGAQSRYLFPVLVPALTLFCLGLREWWPQRHLRWYPAALVIVLASLDITSWITVLVRAYA